MQSTKNPAWWTPDHDSRWDRVKAAFKRDWEQTKHDFGSDSARDLQQSASDTVKQAAGRQQTAGSPGVRPFDDVEPAFRYGHGARTQYGDQWTGDTEIRLRAEYGANFDRDREYIRRGYEYPPAP